jgi:hypothetical protein
LYGDPVFRGEILDVDDKVIFFWAVP